MKRMAFGANALGSWVSPLFRVPMGRVVFEVGGGGIREEIAKEGMSLSL